VRDRLRRPWVLGNQGRVHLLMAGHAMAKIEKIYGSVFENILGEKVSTKPVEIVTPFPWLHDGQGGIRAGRNGTGEAQRNGKQSRSGAPLLNR
jgi:hypothetical protein